MNELIEQLWKEFMCKPLVDGGYTKKDGFKQAIQTACQSQRNACIRIYNECVEYDNSLSDTRDAIEHVEITEQDYE